MTEESTLWLHGDDGQDTHLVANLGLFDVKICNGPRVLLEMVKASLQDKVTAPLKIVNNNEIRGLRPEWSGVPCGFTVVTNDGAYAPEIIY